jgi:hypothetical protein
MNADHLLRNNAIVRAGAAGSWLVVLGRKILSISDAL